AQVRVRVVAGQIGRRGHELTTGQQVGAGAARTGAAQAGNPVGFGGHADLLGGAVVAYCSTGHVRAVRVRPLRLSRAADVEPAVIVVERAAAEVAAILVDQGLVGVAG